MERPESETPEPGCCCLPSVFRKKSKKKSSKKEKKGKSKGDAKVSKCKEPRPSPEPKKSTVPKLPAIGGLGPNVPQPKEVGGLPPAWASMAAYEAKVNLGALRDASLEISSCTQKRNGGVSYDLVDFARPPSRSYRLPKNTKNIPPPATSRMARMDLHMERINALEKEMKEKEERRKKALEAKIMRAHRSTERGQQIREKFIAPLIEADLKVENVTQREDFQAWELADTRPATPVPRPPSRAVSRAGMLLPKASNPELKQNAELKQKKAEEARALALQKQEAKAARRRERMEKSRERRHQIEEDQKASVAKKQAKIKEAEVRRNVVIQDIKMASVLDVSRARHLNRMKKINKMFNRAQNGCGSPPPSPLDEDIGEIETACGDW